MLLVIFLGVLLFALWYWMKPHRSHSPPIFPGAWPIIGHAHKLLVNAQDMWKLEKQIYNYSLQKQDMVQLMVGPRSVYIITDPDDCLTVANTCMDKPYVYHFVDEACKRGLVSAEVSLWKQHRRLLNPAFNQQKLHTYVGEFIFQAKRLVAQLSSEVGKEPFDVEPYFISTIMSTACRTTLGLKTDEDKEIVTRYAQAVEGLYGVYLARFQRIWLHLPFIYKWSSLKKTEDNIINIVRDISKAVITNHKAEFRLIDSSDITKETEAEEFRPLLDHMLDLAYKQDAFNDDEIREHLDTMIAAAYETTAATLTFTLLLLGSHQDVQERVYKELQEVLGDQERDLNKHDLPKLVYMEAVTKEALRLYPPVPRVGRCSSKEVQLKNYIVPANSNFLISVYGVNRHPSWGADAAQFRPERWLDTATLPENPNTFASFSMGRRNCIGKLYSMIAIKTTLAYIVRAYRIKSDIEKLVTRCEIILKPVSGHEIILESRN